MQNKKRIIKMCPQCGIFYTRNNGRLNAPKRKEHNQTCPVCWRLDLTNMYIMALEEKVRILTRDVHIGKERD